jgi:hypothetical protein
MEQLYQLATMYKSRPCIVCGRIIRSILIRRNQVIFSPCNHEFAEVRACPESTKVKLEPIQNDQA